MLSLCSQLQNNLLPHSNFQGVEFISKKPPNHWQRPRANSDVETTLITVVPPLLAHGGGQLPTSGFAASRHDLRFGEILIQDFILLVK